MAVVCRSLNRVVSCGYLGCRPRGASISVLEHAPCHLPRGADHSVRFRGPCDVVLQEDEEAFEEAEVAAFSDPALERTDEPPPRGDTPDPAPARDGAKATAVPFLPREREDVRGPQNYYMEAVAGIILLGSLVLFVIGRQRNASIANAWFDCFRDLLSSQFSMLSVDADEGSAFVKEAHDGYRFYASGRRFCKGLSASLELKPRHSLVNLFLGSLSGRRDMVTLEFPMEDDAMPPVVLAIVPRRRRRTLLQEAPDLARFADVVGVKKDSVDLGPFDVVSDCPSAVKKLVTSEVAEAIQTTDSTGKRLFHMIHFTDQAPMLTAAGTATMSTKALRFQFYLPTSGNMEELRPLMQLVFHLVDQVGVLRLSDKALRQAQESRRKLVAESQRAEIEERQEQKRLQREQEAEEEDARLMSMSKEQRKKADAKRRKKEQESRRRKLQKRVKVG